MNKYDEQANDIYYNVKFIDTEDTYNNLTNDNAEFDKLNPWAVVLQYKTKGPLHGNHTCVCSVMLPSKFNTNDILKQVDFIHDSNVYDVNILEYKPLSIDTRTHSD